MRLASFHFTYSPSGVSGHLRHARRRWFLTSCSAMSARAGSTGPIDFNRVRASKWRLARWARARLRGRFLREALSFSP